MAKDFPSFTEDDQKMAHAMTSTVMGPPAYASPDPATSAGRLVPVDDHPHKDALDETSYGKGLRPPVSLSMDSGALGKPDNPPPPEDREEWTKADWVTLAAKYELPTKGSKAAVREAVEEYEAANQS